MMTSPLASPPSATLGVSPAIVQVTGLVKRYGAFTAVNGIDVAIRPGEIFGLLGPNGAGKTTTLEIIEGIRQADAGTVRVFDLDIRQHRRAIQARIGAQLQATTLFPELNVRETIALFGAIFPRHRPTDEILREVALEEKARALPQNLSGGQRQRLALALALVNDPELLFLDEPTTGLDPQSRRALWTTIGGLRERGKTIILTTHFMDEAQALCDRIAIIDQGQIIAQDSPAGLIARLGAAATVECAVAGATLDELRELPAVSEARQGLDFAILYTDQLEATLTALLRFAAARGAALEHLQVRAPTLEDVFLKLTGRTLRD